MKTCSMCKETKSLGEFHRDSSRPDGCQRQCKACKTVYAGIRRQADLAGYAESQRKWRRSNPNAVRKISERHQLDPKKQSARRAVHEAIRLGQMARPSLCENCGDPCHPHAHHDDYDRPLDVRFLCQRCHLAAHGKTLHLGQEATMIDPSAVLR